MFLKPTFLEGKRRESFFQANPPLKIQIPKSEVDPKLAEKIVSTELPGIMNWVLEGRERLITQSGFTESSLCQKQLEEYRYGSGVRKKIKLILPERSKL